MLKKNFTRKDLSNNVHQNLGFSKNISSLIIDDFFESLISGLIKFNEIKISSFGTFKVVDKKERIGRNPKTKVEAKIVARKVVKFKPSNTIKEQLNRQ
jgi:integration host factor subunit alpha